MLQAVRQSVPFAIGVVVIAAPLLTIALVLATSATKRVSSMFVIGWAAGIMTVLGVIVAFVDTTVPSRGISPHALALIRIGLGAILAFLAFRTATAAVRSWHQRRSGGPVTPPAMIRNLASWSARRSFLTGFSLSSVNPKNVAPIAAGAAAMLEASQAPLEQAFAIIVFTIIASLGIAMPTLLSAFGGQQINSALVRASRWMTSRAETISAIVLAVLAVVLLVKGIAGLSSL
jgi:threonine/homoserine/homoserine lactone efflux protein